MNNLQAKPLSHPKPLAAERKLANYELKHQLRLWRHSQYKKAMERDKGMCRICEKHVAQDVHHIWGRGSDIYDWREDYTSLISVCRKCHPRPIHHRPPKKDMEWIEELQKKINR